MNQQDHRCMNQLKSGQSKDNDNEDVSDAKRRGFCLSDTTETIYLSSSDSETEDIKVLRDNQMLLHLINTDKTLNEEDRQEYAAIIGLAKSSESKQLVERKSQSSPVEHLTIYQVQNEPEDLDELTAVPSTNAKSKDKLQELIPDWDLGEDLGKSANLDSETNTNSQNILKQLIVDVNSGVSTSTVLDTVASTSTKSLLAKSFVLPDTTTVATNKNYARTKNHPSQKKRKLERHQDFINALAREDLNRLESFAMLQNNQKACQLIDELRIALF